MKKKRDEQFKFHGTYVYNGREYFTIERVHLPGLCLYCKNRTGSAIGFSRIDEYLMIFSKLVRNDVEIPKSMYLYFCNMKCLNAFVPKYVGDILMEITKNGPPS
jgi:hypothetical protein